jgi:hypothetical protein
MFGNLLGWIISAIIAAMAVYLGYELLELAKPTAATGWVQTTVKPLDLTEVARAAFEPMDSLKDNAGDLYRQAIADYERNKIGYENAEKSQDLNEANVGSLRGLDLLVSAAHSSSMDLFKSKPDEIVGFNTNVPALDDLEDIAKTAEHLLVLAKVDQNYDLARKYANAVGALGYHLYKERIALVELDKAEELMGDGSAALKSIAQAEHADDKVSAQDQFQTARTEEYTHKIKPVTDVLASQGQAGIGIHAGDMYQLAGDPQIDLVWRVEAIRRIGRLRFNAENSADQLKAPKFLAALADDASQDAVIRAAAIKARDMTSYDNQSQR